MPFIVCIRLPPSVHRLKCVLYPFEVFFAVNFFSFLRAICIFLWIWEGLNSFRNFAEPLLYSSCFPHYTTNQCSSGAMFEFDTSTPLIQVRTSTSRRWPASSSTPSSWSPPPTTAPSSSGTSRPVSENPIFSDSTRWRAESVFAFLQAKIESSQIQLVTKNTNLC